MKKIAVTQRLMVNESYYELRETLDINWGSFFQKLDFLPIILPINYDFEEYFNNIDIDGILLTGGNDLNSIVPSKESSKRDNFEKKIIEYGIVHKIPIFGICRGMQILAEYFNADFIQVKNQVNIRHTLQVNKDSQYVHELNKLSEVNSFHNYAVKNISDELIISAWDKNGIVKAIEHKHYKIFAQMWHSEREKPFNENELFLIKKFFSDFSEI